MKICQVTHLYRPSIGGIENYVTRLNDSLADRGHETLTITTDLSLADETPLERPDDVIYCGTDVTPLRNPFSLDLLREVKTVEADLFHLHSPYFLTSLEAAYALPEDTPAVMTVHGTILDKNLKINLLNTAYQPFASYIFDQVEHNFVQGIDAKRRIENRFGVNDTDISILPNGINLEEYDVDDETIETFSEKFDLDPDLPTTLFVSRLIPEKNPGALIEAVTEYLPDADLQVVLVGDGEFDLVSDLERRADDRIKILSNIEFEMLKSAYHVSDMFVFLGTWEGLPTVVIEAMNGRLPVITTTVGEIPNYLTDPENGQLIDSPPEPAAVAEAIKYYLDNPKEREAVGKRNREYVHEEFQWDDIAAEIEAQYHTVVDGS